MYYPDLGTESQVCSGKGVRAVGWLSRDHTFVTGRVTKQHLSLLKRHLANAYQPFLYRGVHHCEFCDIEHRAMGRLNLLIPFKRFLYVAPELIVHYIEAHNYKPPDEFLAAIEECPDQHSDEYFKSIYRFAKRVHLSKPIWPPTNPITLAALKGRKSLENLLQA